jgi:putative oxidoreductase
MSPKLLVVTGRTLFSLHFLVTSLLHVVKFEFLVAQMAVRGVPAPRFFLILATVLQVLGALSIMLGYKAKTGALLLILFIVPSTPVMHNFWALQGQDAFVNFAFFIRNISILGALLLIIAFGSGPGSLDNAWSLLPGK